MIEAIYHSACVAVLATLISESVLMSRFREKFNTYLVNCPICLGFWLAAPTFYWGFTHYFLVVALSNVWMLVILKLYNELEQSD